MFLKLVIVVALGLSLVTPFSCVRGEAEQLKEGEAKEMLQTITENHLQPPQGRSAAEILPTLARALASPDSQLRDDLASTILSDWIYQKALLTPEQLRTLMPQLLGNLRVGIGDEGNDDVFNARSRP